MRPQLPAFCLAVVLLAAAAGHAAYAAAPPPLGLRLERVDSARCRDGSLQLYITDIEIDGMLSDRPASRFRMLVGDKQHDARPTTARTFADTGAAIHLALVIEASLAYGADLDSIKSAASDLVRSLPPKSTITLVTYGAEIEGLHSRRTPRQTLQHLDDLVALEGLDLSLVDALKAAIKDLDRVPPTERRMIIVMSDGINSDPSWDLFRSIGSRARRLGLPISPIAYSPIDERGPLLNLGELAKRSMGTFRWAKTASDIPQQLRNLGAEISGQLVLSFPIDRKLCDRDLRVRVQIDGQRSNELVVSPGRRQAAKGKRVPWLAIAALLVVVLALAFVTWLLVGGGRRRSKT